MAKPPLYHVFVSHATYDKFLAKVICEKIESLGLTTFRDDRDIGGGDDIPVAVREAIKRSREVVVLFTPESVKRLWVTLEVGMAMMAERRIVPVFYHVPPDGILDALRLKRGYDLNGIDQYLDEIRSRYAEGAE